jgi:ribokinase
LPPPAVFVAQLELSLPVVEHGLALAHELGVSHRSQSRARRAAAREHLPIHRLHHAQRDGDHCAHRHPVSTVADAEKAADAFLARGVRNAIITLGAQGVFVKNVQVKAHVPAISAGKVVETTGAGDAFNGGFAVALSEGMDLVEAARFGCATAGISITRPALRPPCLPARRLTRCSTTALTHESQCKLVQSSQA